MKEHSKVLLAAAVKAVKTAAAVSVECGLEPEAPARELWSLGFTVECEAVLARGEVRDLSTGATLDASIISAEELEFFIEANPEYIEEVIATLTGAEEPLTVADLLEQVPRAE